MEVWFHSATRWDGVKGGSRMKQLPADGRVPLVQQVGRFACCEMKESEYTLQRCFSSPSVKDELRGQGLD